MLKFALKHMATRLGKNILTGLSVVIALTVSLMAYNIANQVKDGVINSYKYYDTIIGPSGSQTQLVLNTLFYTDKPLGLIPYEVYETLLNDRRVAVAIPFGEGDNYDNARIIGTDRKYLDEYNIAQGTPFSGDYQVVIGYNVAKDKGMQIGDTFFSVHGLTTDINSHQHNEENEQYTVVGIMSKTNTAADNVIFTDIESVWETHGSEINDEDDHRSEGVTAIMIKCTSMSAQMSLADEYNKTAGMQSVNPSTVMRELINNIDLTKNIVYVLCGIILVMNLFVICVITMLNMYDIRKDIYLLRLIGVSKKRIETIVYIQNLIISVTAVLIGFLLSRVSMSFVKSITENIGVVLNANKFYTPELVIIFAVVVMTFIPMMIAVKRTFRGGVADEK